MCKGLWLEIFLIYVGVTAQIKDRSLVALDSSYRGNTFQMQGLPKAAIF
jgi:hypothetical protein